MSSSKQKLGRNPFEAKVKKKSAKASKLLSPEEEPVAAVAQETDVPNAAPPIEMSKRERAEEAQAKPAAETDAPRSSSRPKSRELFTERVLKTALSFELERFALWRFNREPSQSRMAMVSLTIRNPLLKRDHQYEMKLVKRGPVAFSLFSLRIHRD